MAFFAQLETEQKGSKMKYNLERINIAIFNTLYELLYGDAQHSAKSLEGAISSFFIDAADWTRARLAAGQFPEGSCYPLRADIDSLYTMCKAIDEAIQRDSSCRGSHRGLIRKIIELSEEYMAKFRDSRNVGTYNGNVSHIRELDIHSDWGRWMLALRVTFIKPEKVST